MTRPSWWAVVSSFAAPVFLIGGWLVAQAAAPATFDAVVDTISDLARIGEPHRWIMTVGLAGLGAAHVVTALGLSMLSPASRAVLALAGVATVFVAVFPEPAEGSSTAHGVSAGIAFVLLALWPATTASRRSAWTRHPVVAIAVSVVSVALLLTFFARIDGATAGAWERGLAAQQALWPLVVALSLLARPRHTPSAPRPAPPLTPAPTPLQ